PAGELDGLLGERNRPVCIAGVDPATGERGCQAGPQHAIVDAPVDLVKFGGQQPRLGFEVLRRGGSEHGAGPGGNVALGAGALRGLPIEGEGGVPLACRTGGVGLVEQTRPGAALGLNVPTIGLHVVMVEPGPVTVCDDYGAPTLAPASRCRCRSSSQSPV